MAVVVTAEQRANPALAGWVAAKDAENAGGNTQAQMQASWKAEGVNPVIQKDGTTGFVPNKAGPIISAPSPTPTPVETTTPATNSISTGNSNPTNDLSSFKQSQTDLINSIYEKQRAAQLQKIKETRDIQLQGLNKVNVQAEDSATAQRGQIAAADIQAGNRLRESMSQMGLLNSGDNLTAQGNLNTQRQSAMGQTNQELARVKQDVSERAAQINNAAASNDLALLQQLQAQQAQDMLALGYKVNDNEYRDAVFGWQQQTDTANLTGNFQNQRTMQGQQFDYGVSRDAVLDNRYNQQLNRSNFESDRSYELAKSSQDWNQTFQKEQYSDQKAQQLWENTFKDKSFSQSMNDAAASRGLQWASLNQRDKEFLADQTFREESFKADQTQRGLDNTYRTNQAIKSGSSSADNFTVDDYKGYINSTFYKDVPANPSNPYDTSKTKKFDVNAAEQYINGLNVTQDKKSQLRQLYQLPAVSDSDISQFLK